MSEKVYVIDRFKDLLHVPIEKRRTCLMELEYNLALSELAFGDQAYALTIEMRWIDDGKRIVKINNSDGSQLLALAVTPNVEGAKDTNSAAAEMRLATLERIMLSVRDFVDVYLDSWGDLPGEAQDAARHLHCMLVLAGFVGHEDT